MVLLPFTRSDNGVAHYSRDVIPAQTWTPGAPARPPDDADDKSGTTAPAPKAPAPDLDKPAERRNGVVIGLTYGAGLAGS